MIFLNVAFTFSQSKVVYNSTTSTINGEPFFVKGIYTGGNADLKKIGDLGINVVMNYSTRDMEQSQALKFLDEAQSHNLYVLFHINKDDIIDYELEKVLSLVNGLKQHSTLYGWYLADEPSLTGIFPEELKEFYEEIKKADPNHPVFTSNWQIQNFSQGTDVDMRQLYHGIPKKMQNVLDDKGEGYISEIEDLNLSWLAILNTHSTKFGNPEIDPLNYASPAGWYNGIEPGTPEYAKRENRGVDLNQPGVLSNPFGKKDRYGQEFVMSENFPDSEIRIRGQVACALAYKSNALYWWLWEDGNSINKRWGWYTIYHYEPTKSSHKKILSEIEKCEDILTSNKEIDTQVSRDGLFYRYIKDESGRELIVAFNETESDISVKVSLLASASTKYVNLTNHSEIDLSTTNLELKANGGVFLIDPDLVSNSTTIKSSTCKLYPNLPNPFRSKTNFKFSISERCKVELGIYNVMGIKVSTLISSIKDSGTHSVCWDGMNINGDKLSPGIYLAVLKAGNEIDNMSIVIQ